MSETTDIVVVGLRALAFIAVLQSAGIALYDASYGAQLQRSRTRLRRIAFVAALGAISLVLIHHLAAPARMTASFSGIWDTSLQLILLQSDAGTATALRVAGLSAIAIAAIGSGSGRQSLLVFGAALALSSFLFMGHTADHPQQWLLAILLIFHLMIAAFWFGALLAFFVTATRESPQEFGTLVREFSNTASLLVPIVLLAGLLMAIILVPGLAALATPYGGLLLFKIAAFALLMALAAWNRLRLSPALVSQEPGALARFRHVVAVEWIVVAVVLGATAIMTGLFTPE